jgi:hypothetical protein
MKFSSEIMPLKSTSMPRIRDKMASPSSSKRANNSEEMAFLSALCSIVRLRGTRLSHRP